MLNRNILNSLSLNLLSQYLYCISACTVIRIFLGSGVVGLGMRVHSWSCMPACCTHSWLRMLTQMRGSKSTTTIPNRPPDFLPFSEAVCLILEPSADSAQAASSQGEQCCAQRKHRFEMLAPVLTPPTRMFLFYTSSAMLVKTSKHIV